MKTLLRAAVCLSLASIAYALGGDTIESVLADPAKYDKKELKVVGKVIEFKQKTSRKGNQYFTIKLGGLIKKDDVINVYSQGKLEPEPKVGDKLQAWGIFRQEKKVLDFTVKNEIDATQAEEKGKKKFGVTPVKE